MGKALCCEVSQVLSEVVRQPVSGSGRIPEDAWVGTDLGAWG